MLKILLKKQLLEIFRGRNGSNSKRKRARVTSALGLTLVFLLSFGILAAMFVLLNLSLCQPLAMAGLSWLQFALLGLIALILGVVGSVFNTFSSLYLAKDNDLLLSMPIPVRTIVSARLISVFLVSLMYVGIVTVPTVVVYLAVTGFTLQKLLGGLVYILALTLFVMALTCLLGWVVAKLSQRVKNKSYVTVLLAVGFLALYYVVYFKAFSMFQDFMQNLALYGEEVKRIYPIYYMGRMGTGDWAAMGICVLAVVLAAALVWLLLKQTFLSISIATDSSRKAVYRERTVKQTSPDRALLRKELGRFTGSATYMLNCGMGLLFLVVMAGGVLFLSKDILNTLGMVFGGDLVAMVAAALLCFSVSMVDITAPSISLEGKNLWIVKTLPVSHWQILRAKLLLHLELTLGPVLLAGVALALVLPAMSLLQRGLVVLVPLAFTVFTALFGLVTGLLFPRLDWTNEMIPLKRGASVTVALLGSMAIVMVLVVLYVVLTVALDLRLTPELFLALVLGILIVSDVLLYLWLKGRGVQRFAQLS